MIKYINIHEKCCVAGMETCKIKHHFLEQQLAALPQLFTKSPLGKSVEGRTIYGVMAGVGAIRVILWSQMHGDESTATRTLFDLFQFLTASDKYSNIRNIILNNLSLLFIPMLNPDGAEYSRRENMWGIDINRDAQRFTTPEGQLLRDQIIKFAPHFSFNLHDQESYYSAGVSRVPATIAFLAPPADAMESITENRRSAMQLIVKLSKQLQDIIPYGVAKWNDTFEPRAFGEWSQGQNSATILVESGGYYNDIHRNFVRKIHFGVLVEALHSIASGNYVEESIDGYFAIPHNRENGMFDTIARKQILTDTNGTTYFTDVAYRKGDRFIGDFDLYGDLSSIPVE